MTGTTQRSKELPPPLPAACEAECVSQIYHDSIILLPRTINCCTAQCQGFCGKICGKLRTGNGGGRRCIRRRAGEEQQPFISAPAGQMRRSRCDDGYRISGVCL